MTCAWLATLAPASAAAGPPVAGPSAAPQAPGDPGACAGAPWMDRTKPAEERARLVVEQMTIDEKVSETGSLLDATHSRETAPIDRLCVPALRLNNGSAGVSTGGPVQSPATALPAPIGLAATWDPELAHRYGVVEGRETLNQGRNLLEGPDINLARVPVNGRTFEAYGEDPFLAGQISVGDIRGIQSQGVIANVKHYAANNQEINRSTINELIDERTLHEIYLPAFEASVRRARSGSVMCAKNQVNSAFSCENAELLQHILKGDWGFDGFVVSDFNSCHNTVNCANNGMEFELPSAKFFGPALKAAVEAGTVTMATLDEHVRRIMATMVRFGVFDRPQGTSAIDAARGGAVSRQIAERAAVLLKNDRNVLPLRSRGLKSVALVGPYAGTAHTGGGGSSRVMPLYTVSPIDGVQRRVGPGVAVSYAPGIATSGVSAVPASALQGLKAEYFANPAMTGTPVLTRAEARIVDDYGGGAPVPGLPVDGFAVRWTATLAAPTTGDYLFGLTNDDNGRVFVDDVLAVDNSGTHGVRTVTATVHLDAGPHAVRVEYADNAGFSAVTFGWAPPGGPTPLQEAVDAARAADVAVVMVGDTESEGRDRPSLALDGGQDALVAAVAAANPRTVVVVKSGAPVLMPWVDQVPAILEAWYPGEEDGNAVAALLFGDVNPSGRLPITFPKAPTDVPANTPEQYPGVNGVAVYSEGIFIGYRHYDAHGITPLFPFGYGLSYTNFALSHLRVGRDDGRVTVSVDVANTGRRTGTQVVQVYIGHPADPALPQPPHQLAGFARVTLEPGEHEQVELSLSPRAFAHWDVATHAWVVSDGTYQVFAGSSSRDLPLSAPVRMGGASGDSF